MEEKYDHLVKVLMIGDSGVGKTCILHKLDKDEFKINTTPTLAIDFKLKVMDINGKKLKMQFWDTAGQERFRTLTQGYFSGTFKYLRLIFIISKMPF